MRRFAQPVLVNEDDCSVVLCWFAPTARTDRCALDWSPGRHVAAETKRWRGGCCPVFARIGQISAPNPANPDTPPGSAILDCFGKVI